MIYCSKCLDAAERDSGCNECARVRKAQVFTLARDVFLNSVAHAPAKVSLSVTFDDHALEALIASDDFVTAADRWFTDGREKAMSGHPKTAQRRGKVPVRNE